MCGTVALSSALGTPSTAPLAKPSSAGAVAPPAVARRCRASLRNLRRLRRKQRLGELERPRLVRAPRSFEPIGVGEPDVGALVVGEVEVVAAERIGHPGGDPDQRRALHVRPHARIHARANDRVLRGSARRGRARPPDPPSAARRRAPAVARRRHPEHAGRRRRRHSHAPSRQIEQQLTARQGGSRRLSLVIRGQPSASPRCHGISFDASRSVIRGSRSPGPRSRRWWRTAPRCAASARRRRASSRARCRR